MTASAGLAGDSSRPGSCTGAGESNWGDGASTASPPILSAAGAAGLEPVQETSGWDLSEQAQIGADTFSTEVIRNVRASGRMLMTNPAVFRAFLSVSIGLSSTSKLVILDCNDKPQSNTTRQAFAVSTWPSGSRRALLYGVAVLLLRTQSVHIKGFQRQISSGRQIDAKKVQSRNRTCQ